MWDWFTNLTSSHTDLCYRAINNLCAFAAATDYVEGSVVVVVFVFVVLVSLLHFSKWSAKYFFNGTCMLLRGLWFRWNVIKRNFSSLESFSGTIHLLLRNSSKWQIPIGTFVTTGNFVTFSDTNLNFECLNRFASWLFVFMAMTSKDQRIFETYYFSTGTMKLLRSVIRWDVFCNKQKSSKSIPTKCPTHLLDSIYITTVAAVATAGSRTDRQTIGLTDSRIS